MKLIIAEKPSVAQTIAKVIGATVKKDGYLEGNGHLISWCIGHLVGLAQANKYDEAFKKWNMKDLPIIPNVWQYEPNESTKKQLEILKTLMHRHDVVEVINACDTGREGELIFRHVYTFNHCEKPIKRLWISSLESTSIKKGLEALREGADFDNLYQSALCRSQADWLIGINTTRLFSLTYDQTLNVGRVMTPTLALITSREDTIKNFVKEELYKVELQTKDFTAMFKFQTDEDKLNKELVESVLSDCSGKDATVIDVKKEVKKQAPPKLFDLTSLQREANKVYGLSAQTTLDTAQSLYEAKLITYPRTDSQFLSDDMSSHVLSLINSLEESNLSVEKIINNQKVTDHHAIIPTQSGIEEWQVNMGVMALDLGQATLSKQMCQLLDLITMRLITATSHHHEYEQTTILLDCVSHVFSVSGKVVLYNGFKDLIRDKETKEETNLPPVNIGDVFEVEQLKLTPYFSKPPTSHTEASLLQAMENAGKSDFDKEVERKGLGTPATRASMIEKLIASGYLVRDKKTLLPTDKGNNLIKILPEKLTSVSLTSDWENKLKEVEHGGISAEVFMNEITIFTTDIILNNQMPTAEKLALFPKAEKEVIGKCPRCGGDVIETPKAYFCEHSRAKKCEFALWKSNKFFTSKKKNLTKQVAQTLLNEGRVFMTGLYSENTGKTYDATIILIAGDEGYPSFKMEFDNKKKRS